MRLGLCFIYPNRCIGGSFSWQLLIVLAALVIIKASYVEVCIGFTHIFLRSKYCIRE